MFLPLLGLSGAAALTAVLFPYHLPLALLALVLLGWAHVRAARRGRRPAALWASTALSLALVAVSLIVGATM